MFAHCLIAAVVLVVVVLPVYVERRRYLASWREDEAASYRGRHAVGGAR